MQTLDRIEIRIGEIQAESGNKAQLVIYHNNNKWYGYIACVYDGINYGKYEESGNSIEEVIQAIAQYMTEY